MKKLILLIAIILSTSLWAQNTIKNELFKNVEILKTKAHEMEAKTLSPENYKEALEYYHEAEKSLQEGEELNEIKKTIKKAENYFQKSIEVCEIGKLLFKETLEHRKNAIDAEAGKYDRENFEEAEELLKDAAEELEDDDREDAKDEARKASKKYSKAELNSIKRKYFDNTDKLLKKADDEDAEDRAEKTLTKSQKLLKKASKEFNKNRYNNRKAIEMVKEAEYEAKHSLYLNKYIKKLDKDDQTIEDLILSCENSIQKVAQRMDKRVYFDQGIDEGTKQLISFVDILKDSLKLLKTEKRKQNIDFEKDLSKLTADHKYEVNSLNVEIENLKKEQESLEAKLKEYELKGNKLQKELDRQNKIKAQFEEVRSLFDKNTARVLRDGNNIIIRLIGLNFDSGKAIIKPEFFSLLAKVKKAINTFEQYSIVVEGHTDSHGGDKENMALSKERANAVKEYLLANMEISRDIIKAVGFGKTKPVASNETAKGREQNRRIDIVIKPIFNEKN